MQKNIKPFVLFLFSLALIFTVQTALGQEDQKNTLVKLYFNASYSITNTSEIFNSDLQITTSEKNKELQIGYFTPSIGFNLPSGNYHEFEMSRLHINKTDNTSFSIDSTGQSHKIVSGDITTNLLIAFRYEYNIMLLKKKFLSKLKPALGFSADPYFSMKHYNPKISLSYPSNENLVGATFSVIPRLIYDINEYLFLDLNIPFSFADINFKTIRLDKPDLLPEKRTTSTINLEAFPCKFLIRFGIGIRI
jgi:hypothetical protein